MKAFFCALIITCLPLIGHATTAQECVILLHGLMRSSSAMDKLEEHVTQAGYQAVNIDYESLSAPVEILAPLTIESGLAQCRRRSTSQIHFVTHSLGGILLRQYLSQNKIEELGNSVMIAPPNNGSQVVDNIRGIPGIVHILGSAGLQLGTDSASIPVNLGPVDYPVGVIAGDRTINPLLSLMLPNPDDGKVSVESTRLEGMRDFIVLHHSHVFIMQADDTIEQTLHFLRTGRFSHQATAH